MINYMYPILKIKINIRKRNKYVGIDASMQILNHVNYIGSFCIFISIINACSIYIYIMERIVTIQKNIFKMLFTNESDK